MFVRNCWYVVGWDYELDEKAIIARTIIGEPLVLYRRSDGSIVALEDRCCHRQAPLSHGRREGDDLRCMYHGLKFNVEGRCIDIPGQTNIPEAARVRRYPVTELHSWIWVWMGDPQRADPALIPQAVGLKDPKWTLRSGQMDYQANYELINDNLCDFSHLAYVHEATFGAGEDKFARTRPKIVTIQRGIRVQRWSVDAPVQQYEDGTRMRADNWMTYDYLAPGILLMLSAQYPSGTAKRLEMAEPTGEPVHANFTSQAVTPVTETTSRYFYSWGPRSCEFSAPQLADAMMTLAGRAFEEDRKMIEAQQRNLTLHGATAQLFITHDRGPSMMREVLKKLIEGEQGALTATRPAVSA